MQFINDSFSPEGWIVTLGPDNETPVKGVWSKPLRTEGPNRSLYLVYFEPGAMYPLHPHNHPQQLLILDGDAEDEIVDEHGRRSSVGYRKGGFVDYPPIMQHSTYCRNGCLMVLGT